jgi:hypothetical protein
MLRAARSDDLAAFAAANPDRIAAG